MHSCFGNMQYHSPSFAMSYWLLHSWRRIECLPVNMAARYSVNIKMQFVPVSAGCALATECRNWCLCVADEKVVYTTGSCSVDVLV
jgi:hypothetical protein